MAIHKIMQPRIDPKNTEKRREIFKNKDWVQYEKHMKD